MTAACRDAGQAGIAHVVVALADTPPPDGDRAGRRRRQSHLARQLARAAAAALLDVAPGTIEVLGGGDARPTLSLADRAADGLALALTHSGLWVGAAAGQGLQGLGIDLQQAVARPVDPLIDYLGYGQLLAPAGAGADQDAFTQLWTMWEAAIKCDGAMLLARTTPAFEQLRTGFQPGVAATWSAGGYWARSHRVDPDHWLTIVTKCAGGAPPRVDLLANGSSSWTPPG